MAASALVETFGPFLIPAVLFGAGLVGYVLLVLLTRAGVFHTGDDPRRWE